MSFWAAMNRNAAAPVRQPDVAGVGAGDVHPGDAHPADAGESANLRRMRAENLVSFVVLSADDIDDDSAELRRLNEWVAPQFAYYEILIVSGQPSEHWRRAMRALGTEIPKFRILILDAPSYTDNSAVAALDHAIGDYVILLYPGEISIEDLDGLLTRMADGQVDLIKTQFRPDARSTWERVAAKVMQTLLRAVTGRRFVRFPGRVSVLSRAAITRIQSHGGPMRFFRFLDLSDLLAEERVELEGGYRSFWGDSSVKLRVTGEVVSISAVRMVRILAMMCFVLGVLSYGAAVFAFLMWLFMSDVAPGWTSQVMLFSFLFGSNFLVLGAVCLGLVRLLHQTSRETGGRPAVEISSGELFQANSDLNVEQDDGMKKE